MEEILCQFNIMLPNKPKLGKGQFTNYATLTGEFYG